MACILLRSCAVRLHDSQAYRKMDVTREGISRMEVTQSMYLDTITSICTLTNVISVYVFSKSVVYYMRLSVMPTYYSEK